MRGLRLEQRLPLLVTFVLAALLGVGTWLAYREVRASSIAAAQDRMESVALQLVQVSAANAQQRSRALAQLAAQPLVAQAARGARSAADPALLESVARLAQPADSAVIVALVRRERTLVLDLLGAGAPVAPPAFDALAAHPDTLIRLSDFAAADGASYYWMAVPITAGPGGGYVAQLRRLTGAGAALEELIGEGATVYLAADGAWGELDGSPIAAPVALRAGREGSVAYERAGERRLGSAQPIPGTAWHVVVERPLHAVLAPARVFAWRFGMVSVLLVLTGMVVTAALSRWLVRPISELGAAARDIAVGAYDRRVGIHRNDEIGQLADAFNTMAGEIERTIADARHSQRTALQANAAKSAFLATMSHEIRTPINAIIGYIELLDMGVSGTLNAEQKQHIARVREASRHLTELVEDVLDISKVEAGELRVDEGVCMSDAVARAALSVVAPQARLRGIELTSDCAAVAFHGDPQRVRQILVNLLSNAVKFTDPGGSVRLRCLYERAPGEPRGACLFEVIDTGCGIAREQQASIFEPFVQLESGYTRSRGGAGLGLAISSQLAQLMGGHITVVSEPGGGSIFSLRLPALPAAAGAVTVGG